MNYGIILASGKGTRINDHISWRGKERKLDFQSSGERNGKRPNRNACIPGFGPRN